MLQANDRVLQHYREERCAQAEVAFTEALKLNPEFALAANDLGQIYFRQDNFSATAHWFENVIKIDPSRAVANLNLGDAYARRASHQGLRTFLELHRRRRARLKGASSLGQI